MSFSEEENGTDTFCRTTSLEPWHSSQSRCLLYTLTTTTSITMEAEAWLTSCSSSVCSLLSVESCLISCSPYSIGNECSTKQYFLLLALHCMHGIGRGQTFSRSLDDSRSHLGFCTFRLWHSVSRSIYDDVAGLICNLGTLSVL